MQIYEDLELVSSTILKILLPLQQGKFFVIFPVGCTAFGHWQESVKLVAPKGQVLRFGRKPTEWRLKAQETGSQAQTEPVSFGDIPSGNMLLHALSDPRQPCLVDEHPTPLSTEQGDAESPDI